MSSISTDTAPSPWHTGELKLQRLTGVAELMREAGGRVIRSFMPDQHRKFFAQLPFAALGTVDREGDVWATLIAGTPGFLHAPTEHTLQLDIVRDSRDPASAGLYDGNAVALIGIELHTRRRNRVNGVVSRLTDAGFSLDVGQSFGNCPQYIQARDFEFVRDPASPSPAAATQLNKLSERARKMVESADTFFVASYVDDHGGRQVDVSHRGGRAGFVRVGEDGVLTIPDFAGNRFYATLGNFLVNSRAGLLFADFESGDVLQLAGDAVVDLDSPEIAAFQGAERLWRFTPRRIVYREAALPLRWKFQAGGWSPNSLMTGNWDEVASRMKAVELAGTWRPFKVAKIVDESSVIRSFHLEPLDGAGLIPHAAGQHLPIRVTPSGAVTPVLRSYTLSTAPADGLYRISVKRQGFVSEHLHDALGVGSVIEARAPAGQFTVDALEPRPAVLLGAGVGVTPMLAMLRHIVYEGLRTRRVRPTWFFQSARTVAERAFTDEIAQLEESAKGAVHVVRILGKSEGAQKGEDFDALGRLDIALLSETLPVDDYDFYLCGPAEFMQSLYDGLRKLDVPDNRIHAEAFGPASLKRQSDVDVDADVDGAPVPLLADQPTAVSFVKSGKESSWEPGSGFLLDLAEASGLSPEFGCRMGICGACRTRIVEGAVAYPVAPDFKVAGNEALICCAVPAQAKAGGTERLMLDL